MMKKHLLLIAALFGAAGVFAAPDLKIDYPEYSVHATSNGDLAILDYDGKPVVKIGKLNFSWSPPVAIPVKIEKIAADTLRIGYQIDRDESGKVALDGTLKALPNGKIVLDWVLNVPESVKTGGTMQELLPQQGAIKSETVYKSGRWVRHEHGGVPYEVRDGYFRSFKNDNISLWMLLGGNSNYSNPWSEHVGFQKGDDGKLYSSIEFQVMPPELEGYAATALFHQRPLGLRLTTDRPFNLWESGSPKLNAELANPGNRTLTDIRFELIGRDFDGKIVLKEKKQLKLNPYETIALSYELPAAEREIYFVEAQASVPGSEVIFTRTNLAILPPHEYKHLAESKFALSAYFSIPTANDVYELMKRMGIRILRHGDNAITAQYGILSLDHANIGPDASPEQAAKQIDQMLARAAKRQNPEIEFCNEWNMCGNDKKPERAKRYVELLREFKKARDKQFPELKIIGMGMAGADTKFLKLTAEHGAVPLMDGGVALHPGRGNTTPDSLGPGWTYLGAIRRYRKVMNELGIKPLHLSEVYACTIPNSSWNDSYRHAAENVILTFAIGLAENVESIQFYQLHDSVWHDLGGVNPADHEYHYGVLMRDGTIKPSLLAFAAVAEALDGAKFTRYLDFGDNVRGIGFDTPRGTLAFLYDRTDGDTLTERKEHFAAAEPWIDTWKTRRKRTFRAIGTEVTVIDAIGRKQMIRPQDGKVALELSGAPLMVYGIELQEAKK